MAWATGGADAAMVADAFQCEVLGDLACLFETPEEANAGLEWLKGVWGFQVDGDVATSDRATVKKLPQLLLHPQSCSLKSSKHWLSSYQKGAARNLGQAAVMDF